LTGSGLGLDDVVLDPARHGDDLVDPAYGVGVDAEVHDQVARRRHGESTYRAETFSPASR